MKNGPAREGRAVVHTGITPCLSPFSSRSTPCGGFRSAGVKTDRPCDEMADLWIECDRFADKEVVDMVDVRWAMWNADRSHLAASRHTVPIIHAVV